MRNVFEEYKKGKITWDEAYRIANNNAAKASEDGSGVKVQHWTKMMYELGVDLSDQFMKTLGYQQDSLGVFSKPGKTTNSKK